MASRTAKAEMKRGAKGKQIYNAQGSEAIKAAEDEIGDFKKGGKVKKGGHVEGEKMHHMSHKPRGAHKRKAGGKTPYSSGHATSDEKDGHSGHEGERPGE